MLFTIFIFTAIAYNGWYVLKFIYYMIDVVRKYQAGDPIYRNKEEEL